MKKRIKEGSPLTENVKKRFTEASVVSYVDFQRLKTRVVQEYLAQGYVLQEDNCSRSDHRDYIPMKRGSCAAVVSVRESRTRTTVHGGVPEYIDTVTLLVHEAETEVFRRTFFEYDGRHATRYCDSLSEWKQCYDTYVSRFRQRAGLWEPSQEWERVLSPKTTPHWDKIAARVLPKVRSRKGFKRARASDIEKVKYRTRRWVNEFDRTYSTFLYIKVYTVGKQEPAVDISSAVTAPSCYTNIHDIRDGSDRLRIHGSVIPKAYLEGSPRPMRVVQDFAMRDEGETVGRLFLATHPVFGTTYLVADKDGKMVVNGYIPVEGGLIDVKGPLCCEGKLRHLPEKYRVTDAIKNRVEMKFGSADLAACSAEEWDQLVAKAAEDRTSLVKYLAAGSRL